MVNSKRVLSVLVAATLSVGMIPSLSYATPENTTVQNGVDEVIGEQQAAESTADADNVIDDDAIDETGTVQTPSITAEEHEASHAADPEVGLDDQQQADEADGIAQSVVPAEEQNLIAQADDTLSGVYLIRTKLSGARLVDIIGGSLDDGANAQLFDFNTTAAQRFRFELQADGFYKITDVNSGKVLDVSGGVNASGANVQQYASNDTAAQRWLVSVLPDGSYTIESKLKSSTGESLCLDVYDANGENGTNIHLFSSNNTDAQKWSLSKIDQTIADGMYTVTNVGSGKVLDVFSSCATDAGNIQQFTSNSSLAQRISVSFDPYTGYYRLNAGNSGKAFDVSAAGDFNGSNIQQYSPNGTAAQLWSIFKNGDGSYTLYSALGGRVIDISGGSVDDCANAQLYESNGTAAQKWRFDSTSFTVPTGIYTLFSSYTDGKVLDVFSASTKQGANVDLFQSNGTGAQKFAIVAYGSTGYYTIKNLNSGKLVGVKEGSSASGANVDQGAWNGSSAGDSQLWRPELINGGIVWVSKLGTVLDVVGGSDSNGANVQAFNRNDTNAQKWSLATATYVIEPGVYTIISSVGENNSVVDIENGSTADGARLQIFTSNDSEAQRFYVSGLGGGFYSVICMGSNKAIDVPGASISSGGTAPLQQYAKNGSDAQQFRISINDEGYAVIASKLDESSVWDVANASSSNGTKINLFPYNATKAQQFTFVKATSNTSFRQMNMTLQQMASWQSTTYHTYDEYLDYFNPDREGSLTRFADVRINTLLSGDALSAYISSTSTGRSGNLVGTGQTWKEAAEASGLNEAYLLAHGLLESGWGTSELSRGYKFEGGEIDGTYYPAGTYYNYFGIGAYDNSPLSGGRKYAIINGWNSREAAIKGGASWIAANYVYRDGGYAQPTLYDMRVDTAYSNAHMTGGTHQYATSLTWMFSIANMMDQCYSSAGVSPNLSYIIPQYK